MIQIVSFIFSTTITILLSDFFNIFLSVNKYTN